MGASDGFQTSTIDRDREKFVLELLGDLADVLKENVGLEEASQFISLVGTRIGLKMSDEYREAVESDRLTVEQVAKALVDLKARIQGGFHIVELTDDKIVLENTRCPFGDMVVDRPILCMMTSNVFGRLTAENLGYARVVIEKAIARGAPNCRVAIHLDGTEKDIGREYFS